jgi:hypothetical protein
VKPRHGSDEHDNGGKSDEAERDVGGRAIDPAALAEEQREAENEQEVAGDRAYERRPDDHSQPIGGGDDGNDQFRRVTERRVQEAADPGTGVAGQVVRRLADQPGKGDQRHAGKHEQRQLADGVEPLQNHDKQRQQQRQDNSASDVPAGPGHTVTLLGDARHSRRSADPAMTRIPAAPSPSHAWSHATGVDTGPCKPPPSPRLAQRGADGRPAVRDALTST